MKIKPGYLYHIKNEFFDVVGKDVGLMTNHENGGMRPSYFVLEYDSLLWFIPLSTKAEKYKKIEQYKKERYGECNNIIMANIHGEDVAILIQNAFPTLPKYISHQHTVNGKPYKVPEALSKEILRRFKILLNLKENGTNLFFTDIDKIEKIMREELIHN